MTRIEPMTAIIISIAVMLGALFFVHPVGTGVWGFVHGEIWLSEKCVLQNQFYKDLCAVDMSPDVSFGYRWILICGVAAIAWAINELVRKSS
jgi:hypothetical protein